MSQNDMRSGATAVRLLRQLGELFGPGTEAGLCHEREWASATFSGARHSLEFHLPLPGPDAPLPTPLADLPDHEFSLPGEIVADCSVALRPRMTDSTGNWRLPVLIEILTVTAD
jgi:hypothetical protein